MKGKGKEEGKEKRRRGEEERRRGAMLFRVAPSAKNSDFTAKLRHPPSLFIYFCLRHLFSGRCTSCFNGDVPYLRSELPCETTNQIIISLFVPYISHEFPFYLNILVGGLEHLDYFPIYWEVRNPTWRTPSFFRGVGQPPTSIYPFFIFHYID